MSPREVAQARMNMVAARGQAAVEPGTDSAKDRSLDIKTYYNEFGEMPSPGKGVLKRPSPLQTQDDRDMDRMDEDQKKGRTARAIAEKARRQGRYTAKGVAKEAP